MATDTEKDIRKSVFEMQLDKLKGMPDSPEKEAILEKLFQDYAGQEGISEKELAIAERNLQAVMPRRANWAEALGKGMQYAAGGYGMRKALEAKEKLSADRTTGLTDFVRQSAAYQEPEAPAVSPTPVVEPQPAPTQQAAPNPQTAQLDPNQVAASLRQSSAPQGPQPAQPPLEMRASHPQPTNPQMPMMPSHQMGQTTQPQGMNMTPVAGGFGELSNTMTDEEKRRLMMQQFGQ